LRLTEETCFMLSQFKIYDQAEFSSYILATNFSRPIKFIQNHHTWKPSYQHLTPLHDEMYWLEAMRKDHVSNRKWSDIGQNITTFPSGRIAVCRPINITPAGIFGANTGGICIEHFGNFDEEADLMTNVHKECIINTNAVLCHKFGLKPNPSQVVYHHWYNTSGKRFTDNEIDSGHVLKHQLQKTCPGTNFFSDPGDTFKGNTISSAIKNFYPLISAAMRDLTAAPAPSIQFQQKKVKASILNVRAGKGTGFSIVKKLAQGTLVGVYEQTEGWCRINASSDEWVSAQFLS
jgi:hypothetical protein